MLTRSPIGDLQRLKVKCALPSTGIKKKTKSLKYSQTQLQCHRRARTNCVIINKVLLSVRCMVKEKEKYFKAKYRPADILLNINAMRYFKLELQLKFRDNKNYFSITVKFHTHLC
jgi:hypothetical protein